MEEKTERKTLDRRLFLKGSLATTAMMATSSVGFTSCDSDHNYPYDIIIKNGTVYNGIDFKPTIIDIGIKGDKISKIGKIDQKAQKMIDAKGFAVTPGFIDVHTHCDLTFIKSGWKRHLARLMPSWKGNHNYLSQGVTTVVTGNCGWGYADIDEWFGLTESLDFGTNLYHLAPHGMIREELFGADQPRELNNSQMVLFKNRIQEQFDKGAIGLSTGLEYAPGLLASTEELAELCGVVAKYNRVHATHIRNESAAIDIRTNQVFARQSIEEAIEIGRRSGAAIEISHLKIAAPINDHPASLVLDPIEKARAEGLQITADQYPYSAGSTIISVLLPHAFRSSDGVKEKFKTKEGRAAISTEIRKVFNYLGPDKTLITMYPEKEEYEGKTIQQIAEIEGTSPEKSYANMVCEDASPVGVFFGQSMDVVKEIMPKDYILTGSDGWTVPKDMTKPHPRTYGTFPRKLGQFARKEKIIELSTAIRSMTSLPAETFRMKGRGKLKEGYFADIAIIDLNSVIDKASFLDPHHYSTGITHLVVNGKLSIENSEFTGDRSGKSLRA